MSDITPRQVALGAVRKQAGQTMVRRKKPHMGTAP